MRRPAATVAAVTAEDAMEGQRLITFHAQCLLLVAVAVTAAVAAVVTVAVALVIDSGGGGDRSTQL